MPGGYRVNGKKVWITKAQQAERMLLLCRTTKRKDVEKKTDGMTLLFAEMDRDHVDIREIPKLGRNAVNTNELFIDDLFVADEDVVGEVGKGFRAILAGLNAERIIASNAAIGIGRAAVRRAHRIREGARACSDGRSGRTRGSRSRWPRRSSDWTPPSYMVNKAAWLLDNGCRAPARPTWASSSPVTRRFKAADVALQTHGGLRVRQGVPRRALLP